MKGNFRRTSKKYFINNNTKRLKNKNKEDDRIGKEYIKNLFEIYKILNNINEISIHKGINAIQNLLM